MFRRIGPFNRISQSSSLLTALCVHSCNSALYAFPAICLAADPSLAMKLTGLLYVMGIVVYIINSWSCIPVFIYGLLLPAIGMMTFTILQSAQGIPETSPMTHWGIVVGMLFLFIYACIDTMRQHLSTQMSLFDARRDAAARLSHMEEAHRLDALTDLLNRNAFDISLHVMLEDRAVSGGEVAVYLVDLDSFKPINDTYSHDQDVGGSDDALAFAERIAGVIKHPIEWSERTLKIRASIGVAVTDTHQTTTVAKLCSAADQAMFAAKSAPSGRPILYQAHLFAPRMTPDDKQALSDGILNRDVRPFYQPKIHLPTGQIIGFEALARWDHATRGIVQPTDFVDQITELGLQGDFMLSMAKQVIEDVNAMLDRDLDPGQVSLNVSEVALATLTGRQELVTLIEANPKAADHLTFEITEDVFIARAADTIQASIAAFRSLGVRISLDDFGTGFASFHHLRQLEFDELKIDTTFIDGLGHDATAEVLVRGFLNIASGLGVSVVAEGVETADQSRDLINMGCLTAQGYLFSAAVPLTKATDLLVKQQAA